MLHNVYRYDEQRINEVNLPPPLKKLINSANLGRLTANNFAIYANISIETR